LLSCVATFNLALAYQISSNQVNGLSSSSLRKAARLYELYIVLQDEHSHEDEKSRDASFFDLAIANNLGIVLVQLDRPNKTKQFFHFSLSALMLLLNGSRKGSERHSINIEDVDGFLGNLSCTMSSAEVAAAA